MADRPPASTGGEAGRLTGLPLFASPVVAPSALPGLVARAAAPTVRRPPRGGENFGSRAPGTPPSAAGRTSGKTPPAAGKTPPAAGKTSGKTAVDAGKTERPAERVPAAEAVGDGGLDWAQVRAFRQQAAELLTARLRDRPGADERVRREIGRALVVAMLRDHADSLLADGGQPPTPAQEQALAAAVFDALFGLGRLQPLVDDPDVENIEITGCDSVHLDYGDGHVLAGPPVADSDEELIETLAFLAAHAGTSARPFTPAHPILDLTLHGGARLAARAWITPRPVVVIRRHRLLDVDLADLTDRGTLDPGLAEFLAAAVRANKTIVVSGAQGAGKTTLVRALCNEIDPWERLGTIETEYELGLHDLPDRHHRLVAHESRPGSGERTGDGRSAGEVTLDDLLYASLRLNLARIIVGEVRGREVIPMFKAMQAGAGSLSTTHAHSARGAIERLVTCALEAGPHITTDYAYLQIDQATRSLAERGVIVTFDSDPAGHEAALRAFPLLRAAGAWPASATLPAGGDPAELLQARGAEDLRATLDRARQTPLADLVIDEAVARWQEQLRWPEGKVNAGRAAVRLITTLPPEQVGRQVARLAQRLDLPTSEVTGMLVDALAEPGPGPAIKAAVTGATARGAPSPPELVRGAFPNPVAPAPGIVPGQSSATASRSLRPLEDELAPFRPGLTGCTERAEDVCTRFSRTR